MPFANKTTVKIYEDHSWPGCDVVLVEEQGYLDLFISADDGSHYEQHRVTCVEEADALAEEFFNHLESNVCSNCSGDTCGQKDWIAFGWLKCDCQ